MKWIAIKDEKPPIDVWVLFYLPQYESCLLGQREMAGVYGEEEERYIENREFMEINMPSHWMPLPPKPEEGK